MLEGAEQGRDRKMVGGVRLRPESTPLDPKSCHFLDFPQLLLVWCMADLFTHSFTQQTFSEGGGRSSQLLSNNHSCRSLHSVDLLREILLSPFCK